MATLLPPPKRQKTSHGAERVDGHNVLVQFVSDETGQPISAAVSVPADVNRAGLEMLINTLTNDQVPFEFHVQLNGATVVISDSIHKNLLEHPSNHYTEEDTILLRCIPQSVYRVRPATRCSATLSGHSSPILCANFSPTGSTLATGSGDTTVRLWNLSTETPAATLKGHKGWVLCVEWEARERFIASGGHDGHIRLWNPTTAQPLGDAMKGHTKWITSLAWEPIHLNPSTPRLASSSKDCTVRVWNTNTRSLAYSLGGHTASVNVVKWSGAGMLYTASSDRTLRVWDASNGSNIHILKDHAHWVTTLALSTDFVLRTGPFNWENEKQNKKDMSDAQGESVLPPLLFSTIVAKALALERYNTLLSKSGSEELCISGSDDHTLFLWSPSSGKQKPLARLTGHQRQVAHVAFSPDGRWIASASFDTSIRIWSAREGKFVATLRGHVGPVYRLTWSADSRLVVSASKDATVKIWSMTNHRLHTDLPGHTDEVYCVDFVADKICSGGRDGAVKM